MKKLFLSIFALSLAVAATAQSVTKADAFGFEPMGAKVGGYWWTPKDRVQHLSTSDEQAASGKYSLKFDCNDFGSWTDIRTQSSSINSPIALEEGQYVLSMMVYLTDKAPSAVRMSISDEKAETKGFKTVIFKNLDKQERNKWVEVTLKTKLPTFTKAKMILLFEKESDAVGKMYIDDIKITPAQ